MKNQETPFQLEHLDEEQDYQKADTFTLRLNKDEREYFDSAKKFIDQVKDSTAIKQYAWIGMSFVLHDKKTRLLLEVLFKNKRNNKRLGIVDFE